ncbi:hypothetical protein GEMRC1_001825 [Eukaryota sp. GEM-RC1]
MAHACVLDQLLSETKRLDPTGKYVSYFTVLPVVPPIDFISCVPCSRCPVRYKCLPVGEISPGSCLYIEQWGKGNVGWVGEGDLEDMRLQEEQND